jgi:hypothetical protein
MVENQSKFHATFYEVSSWRGVFNPFRCFPSSHFYDTRKQTAKNGKLLSCAAAKSITRRFVSPIFRGNFFTFASLGCLSRSVTSTKAPILAESNWKL